jgi:predicted O-methyltransferase YrrM
MKKSNGNDIGEDLAFCIRAKKAGFKIWCDPTIPLNHIGEQEFNSKTYYDWMKEDAKKVALPYDNKIEGWMSKEELNWLYKVAKDMKDVVEIGSWKGRSTHALLTACKGIVTAIDTFKGSPGETAHKGVKNLYKDFMKNVGKFKNLKVMKMDSIKASKKFKGKADMVFLDGAHTYEAVKADIEAWLPKAGKLICGHDFQWSGVQKAVTEKLGFVHTQGTIWYKKL